MAQYKMYRKQLANLKANVIKSGKASLNSEVSRLAGRLQSLLDKMDFCGYDPHGNSYVVLDEDELNQIMSTYNRFIGSY